MSTDAPDRDPALDRAWREHSRETPPPDLDRAILAAAHRAVGSRPQAAQATLPQRWWMPLAAAAAIGVVVVGIMQTMPQDQGVLMPGEPVAPGAPASVAQKPAAPAAAEPATAMAERAAVPEARRAEELFAQKKKQDAPTAAPVVPVVPPAAAPTAPIAAPPPASMERDVGSARGKLDAAHVPEPFPAAAAPRKAEEQEMKRLAPGAAGGANRMAQAPRPPPSTALAPAPAAAPSSAPASALSASPAPAPALARGASVPAPAPALAADSDARKDVAGERQQLAGALAPPPAAPAPAQPARATESVMTAKPAAPSPAPAMAMRSRDMGAARNEPQSAIGGAPQSAATGAAAPLAKTAAVTDELRAKARDPDAWIARIRKLRDEGNVAEAMRELRDFRNLVPDAERRLPADLRDWANTVKP